MFYTPYTININVNVSVIFNDSKFDSHITHFKVIYSDAFDQAHASGRPSYEKWNIIDNEANGYKYALHFPLPYKLDKSNWPYVKYNIHPFNPTNSNTFIRHLVRSIGKGGSDGDVFWGWDVGQIFSWEIGADYPDKPSVKYLEPYPIRKSDISPMGLPKW